MIHRGNRQPNGFDFEQFYKEYQMNTNRNLSQAKKNKNDEFYTRYEDIEKELVHYKEYLRDKIIYCNCDSTESNFYKYFKDNFNEFGLKELWCTSLNGEYIRYNGKLTISDIDGDMFSEDCLDLLKRCDIVVTNPPFSRFLEIFSKLIEYNKQFLIIGNPNAITYKEVFPLIRDNKMWLGFTCPKDFLSPENEIKKLGLCNWFTNLPNKKRNEEIILFKEFNENDFPKYDNYIAWNVDKTKDIPVDKEIIVQLSNDDYEKAIKIYNDDCQLLDIDKETGICKVLIKRPIWGVPISFLDKYNPEQFEIYQAKECITDTVGGGNRRTYRRVLIRQD